MSPIRSMTGFGRASQGTAVGMIAVEVRSVNNRFLDLSVALPREWSKLEPRVRQRIQATVRRGKVDARIRVSGPSLKPRIRFDRELAQQFVDEWRALQPQGELPWHVLVALPGVVEIVPPEADEEAAWAALAPVLDEALAALDASRVREGEALAAQLAQLTHAIRADVAHIADAQPLVLQQWRRKFTERLAELARECHAPLEESRVAMEAALFADRSDVSEELVRLQAHLDKVERSLAAPDADSNGKALEFLVQEMSREATTLSGKCRELAVLDAALAVRSHLEKMREQIQNIE